MGRSAKPPHISIRVSGWSINGAKRSQPVATSGKWGEPRKRLGQAKTVGPGCDRLPIGALGKEEVDHLQAERPSLLAFLRTRAARCCLVRQPPSYTRTTQALPGGSRS
jgi:hypothetical protein